jgi:hypothetical protein
MGLATEGSCEIDRFRSNARIRSPLTLTGAITFSEGSVRRRESRPCPGIAVFCC